MTCAEPLSRHRARRVSKENNVLSLAYASGSVAYVADSVNFYAPALYVTECTTRLVQSIRSTVPSNRRCDQCQGVRSFQLACACTGSEC